MTGLSSWLARWDVIVHDGRLDADVSLLSKPYSREDLARKIRLMFAARVIEPAAAAPERAAQLVQRSVLVVEDDDDIRELVVELLAARGHQVQSTGDAEQAQRWLQRERFDVLFTDVSLPGISGIELARTAVQLDPQLHVVIATGHGTASLLDAATVSARAVLLSKPFEEREILHAVEQAASG